MMNKYRDSKGNKCSLRQLVIQEPDWAVSRITVGKYSQNDVDIMLKEQRQMCADAAVKVFADWNFGKPQSLDAALIDACINAGESDEN